jgi:hypothetical protein
MYQPIENVQTLAGQQITVSFWAKADSARTSTIYIAQNFGSGGSAPVSTLTSQALTTSWVRYSLTVTLGSISGKTIGTSSSLSVGLFYTAGNATGAPVMDVWGFQVEAGSVATAFQTATGTIQGELAAAQRYYYRTTSNSFEFFGQGSASSTTAAIIQVVHPVQMRVAPTSLDQPSTVTNNVLSAAPGVDSTISGSITLDRVGTLRTSLSVPSTSLTQYRPYSLISNGTSGFIGLSAEL